jgi:hypothetical protein
MSSSYSLDIATDMTPAEAIEFLLNEYIGLSKSKRNTMIGEGLLVVPAKLKDPITYKEIYGIRLTLGINFYLDYDEDLAEAHRIIGLATAVILKKERGDAVLTFDGGTPILKRVTGHTVYYKEKKLDWLVEVLEAERVSFDRG